MVYHVLSTVLGKMFISDIGKCVFPKYFLAKFEFKNSSLESYMKISSFGHIHKNTNFMRNRKYVCYIGLF